MNPGLVEPVSEQQKDQEMGFAPSPSTDGSAFHLNAGKCLYPVVSGNEKAFIGVPQYREHDEKYSKSEPWGYANMALALGAPEQGKTWEWLQ